MTPGPSQEACESLLLLLPPECKSKNRESCFLCGRATSLYISSCRNELQYGGIQLLMLFLNFRNASLSAGLLNKVRSCSFFPDASGIIVGDASVWDLSLGEGSGCVCACFASASPPSLTLRDRGGGGGVRSGSIGKKLQCLFLPPLSSNPDGDDAASSFGSWHWEGGTRCCQEKKRRKRENNPDFCFFVGTRHEIIPQYPT